MKKIFTLLFAVLMSTTMFADYYLIGSSEHLGNWALENAVGMPDDQVTVSLPAGSYEFKVLPQNTGWDNELNSNNVDFEASSKGVEAWQGNNIRVTLETPGDMTVKVVEGKVVVLGTFKTPAVVTTYYLVGGGEKFGDWKLENALPMVDDQITMTVDAGTYEFKVLTGRSWDGQLNASKVDHEKSSANVRGTDNIHITLAEAGSFTVKVEAGKLVITGTFSATDMAKEYTIVGDPNLLGSNWDLNDANNLMTLNDGVATYNLEAKELAAGDYEWKVVGDHAWSIQYPQSGNFILTIAKAAKYNVAFSVNLATGEGNAVATEIPATAITSAQAQALNGKFIENGHIVILRNGVRYNVAGIRK